MLLLELVGARGHPQEGQNNHKNDRARQPPSQPSLRAHACLVFPSFPHQRHTEVPLFLVCNTQLFPELERKFPFEEVTTHIHGIWLESVPDH